VTNAGAVSILLGNGDDTFQGPVYYNAPNAVWVTAADLNGDGKTDLAAADSGEILVEPPGVDVLEGNGDGTFEASVFYPAGAGNADDYFVAVGDFNNDGRPDLVVVDEFPGQVTTLLNTGQATFSPTSPLQFSGQLLGTTSAPQTLTLTNSGTTSMTISSVEYTGAPFHMTQNTCSGSLAPGAQCAISIEFSAKTTGITAGDIEIRDSASSKPQVVELSGVGTELGISPDKLLFPEQKIGTQSAPRTVHLTNVGKSSLNITEIAIGGIFYQDFPESTTCGSSLAPKASCAITVSFKPQHKGLLSAWIEIGSNGGDSPSNIPLSGRGE